MTDNDRMSHKGLVMVPPWVIKKSRTLFNAMSGEHAQVYVGMAALLGENGYSLATVEESMELDPMIHGSLMLQGYNFLAGAALGKILNTVATELRHPDCAMHAAARTMAEENETDVAEEHKIAAATIILVRNAAENAIRKHLRVMFQTAGMEIQRGGENDWITAGISQMLGVWIKISGSAVVFQEKPRD